MRNWIPGIEPGTAGWNILESRQGRDLVISSKLDVQHVKEAAKLERTPLGPVWGVLREIHVWVFLYCAIVLTALNVFWHAHGDWTVILVLYAVGGGMIALRVLRMNSRLRLRVTELNRSSPGIELTNTGVRFHMPDKTMRFGTWDSYPETRVGSRVLLIYYRTAKAKKKYFIVPLDGLARSERHEVLRAVPERIRGRSLGKELDMWRLG
jgi:hypothetical protein